MFNALRFLIIVAISGAASGCHLGRNFALDSESQVTSTYVFQPTYAPALLYTDGEVRSLASKAGRLFMGGSFRYTGPYTRSAPAVDLNSGAITTPSIRFGATSTEPDGSGGYYVGGTQGLYDGSTPDYYRVGLKHVLSDGAIDAGFAAAISGGHVFSMKKSGNTLYLAGNFVSVGGQPRQYLAAVDATSGAVLPFQANLSVSSPYYAQAIELVGSTLYVGGSISSLQAGGTGSWITVSALAAVDAATGATLQWAATGYNGTVLSLKATGGKLYVGGTFTQAESVSRNRLAVYNITTPSLPVLLSSDPLPSALTTVHSMTAVSGKIFATGEDSTGSPTQTYAIAIDTSNDSVLWSTLAIGNPSMSYSRSSIASNSDGSLIALGINNDSNVDVRKVAASNGNLTDISFGNYTKLRTKKNSAASTIYGLTFVGTKLVVAGDFQSIALPRNGAAEIDVDTNAPTAWNPDVGSGSVNAIALGADKVFLGGNFSGINVTAGSVARSNIAAVAYDTGTATTWDPGAGTNGSVDRLYLKEDNGVLGAVGSFSSAGGLTRNGIAAFDSDDATVDSTFDPASMLTCSIYTTAMDGDDLFVSSCASGSPAIIKLSFSSASFPGIITLNAPAYGLALDGDHLYAMGPFTQVYGSTARSYFAKFNRVTGTLATFNVTGFPSSPGALHVSPSGKLFMGTDYSVGMQIVPTDSSSYRRTIASVDTVTGAVQSLWLGIATSGAVRQFHSIGKTTYVIGQFDVRISYTGWNVADIPNIATIREDSNGVVAFVQP